MLVSRLARLSCYQMRKHQKGTIVIWVMFLILITTSSSLTLGGYTFSQLKITNYYDQNFKIDRDYRKVTERISDFLGSHAGEQTKLTDFVLCSKDLEPEDFRDSCVLISSTDAGWIVKGSLVSSNELARSPWLNSIASEDTNINDSVYRLAISLSLDGNKTHQWIDFYHVAIKTHRIQSFSKIDPEIECALCEVESLSSINIARVLSWRL